MNLQKIGGLGSLVNAFLMIFILLMFNKIEASDFYDPSKGFDAISTSLKSFRIIFYPHVILSGIAFIPIVLALRERMQDKVPNIMRIAVIGVAILCALWFAGGFIGVIGMPVIVSAKDPSAYRAAGTIILSLCTGGEFTIGWVLLLIGWAALRIKGLPWMLSCLCILKGLVMILDIAVVPMVILGSILGIVFYPWLGIVLLRSKS